MGFLRDNVVKMHNLGELTQESQNLLCYRFHIKRSDSFLYKNK
jgi:hypothetical protein